MKQFVPRLLPIVLLVFIIIFYGMKINPLNAFNTLQFTVETDGSIHNISCWNGDNSGTCYIFLPAYTSLDDISIAWNGSAIISERTYKNGEVLQDITWDTEYDTTLIKSGGKVIEKGKVVFTQSANIPAMFIETESGTINSMHKDKEHKESGRVTLINSNGAVQYIGNLQYIKGRGNTTWTQSEKKPYKIKLPQSVDLLDIGKSTSWCLLSNDNDPSNLRNKVVFDFAQMIMLSNTPGSAFIDLYLNGEYTGLYLLTQGIEVTEGTEELINNYLLELTPDYRVQIKDTIIKTLSNKIYVTRGIQSTSEELFLSLAAHVQAFENAVFSINGRNENGQYYSSLIDLDSWVKKYLVEQFFTNTDSGLSSQFFYAQKNAGDFLLYAGPVWDYDLSMGAFRGINPYITGPEFFKPLGWYYDALFRHADFSSKVKDKYKTIYPIIKKFINERLPKYKEQIASSVRMNNLRWRGTDFDDGYNTIMSYMTRRCEFLYRYLVEDVAYSNIELTYNSDISPYLVQESNGVKTGDVFEHFPVLTRNGYTFSGWFQQGSDIQFEPSTPITEDIQLFAKWISPGGETIDEQTSTTVSNLKINRSMYLLFFFVAIMVLFLLILVWLDNRRNSINNEHLY